jgi:putative heme-binding domain-containing protein
MFQRFPQIHAMKTTTTILCIPILSATVLLLRATAADGIQNAPMVQMHVPGFTVSELPVSLTALNNIEYGPDGRLYAGGYDGRFHLLTDTDGDGLEDRVDTFSPQPSDDYPLGLVVKDGMPHALLADEIVRFRDTDHDGIPDRRETVLKGWDIPELKTNSMIMHRRVDSAMGLIAGLDGSWYITMGSANPGNGYWQEVKGDVWNPNTKKVNTPTYSTNQLRGCLLRFSPDGRHEILSSGLRYVMSLQFNRDGDLFGTDQEGATWLPNGNPFDELLNIQPGRHYGFPPRHPVLLPNVVDEPSVWNFAPQHQSACGFRFNGPFEGRGRFGPEFWADNAIVTGESRGKLWRTTLAKTPSGYVARTEQIASLRMLVVDCAIAPDGALVVCCHAGPPDWGSGPAAIGKLFKIRYTAQSTPQPLLTWPASSTETIVEFDRPLPKMDWSEAAAHSSIEFGHSVGTADRFEAFRPGYAVIQLQQAEPRHSLSISSVRPGDNGRSLILQTPPRSEAVRYAITLPSPDDKSSAVDLVHDLSGVSAAWVGSDRRDWQGWLPHLDLSVIRAFTKGSVAHQGFIDGLKRPGRLTLRGQLDLWNMLRPATQPGAKLDYVPGPEQVIVAFKADGALTLETTGAAPKRVNDYEWRLGVSPEEGRYIPFVLTLATPARSLDVSFSTSIDSRPRALNVQRMLLPFATPPSLNRTTRTIPEIAGGDWAKGRELFVGKASCALCHQIRGQGQSVGPDLSNLPQRDYASVLKDIREPSATINPDAIAYTVTLRDHTEVVGVRANETDIELQLKAAGGIVTTMAKKDIVRREAIRESLMPPGLLDALTPQEKQDLMTFLLTLPKTEKH